MIIYIKDIPKLKLDSNIGKINELLKETAKEAGVNEVPCKLIEINIIYKLLLKLIKYI